MRQRIDFSIPGVLAEVSKKLVDNTPIAYCILDRDMQVHYANRYFYQLKKVEGDVVGSKCFMIANNGVPCDVCMIREAMDSRRPRQILRKEVLPDGSVRHFEHHGIPLIEENGEVRFLLEMHIDRSDEQAIREDNHRVFIGMVEALISILDKKDNYTSTHSRDVAEITLKLGARLGLDRAALDELHLAALLHDVGKIYVPDVIINKTTRLVDEEYESLKRHPAASARMLRHLTYFSAIADIAGHHHEHWDGGGYPDGLKGEEIPLGARIIAVADTYDAITSTRSYRHAKTHAEALAEIRRISGSQLDPALAREFLVMVENEHPDRASLIAAVDERSLPPRGPIAQERRMVSADDGRAVLGNVSSARLRRIMGEEYFIKAIMDNSPCHYRIIDEDFNLLYVSDSLVRASGLSRGELLSMHCFEMGAGERNCFEVRDGQPRCPAVRARRSGTMQRGKIEFNFSGRPCYCDVYSVPMEIVDSEGRPCRCIMEILLDRTEVKTRRRALNADIRGLLDMLFDLVLNIDSTGTRSSEDIIRECVSFGSYISAVWQRKSPPSEVVRQVSAQH